MLQPSANSLFKYPIEIIGLLVIAILAIFYTGSGYIYDEPYYLSNVAIIKEHGISNSFLINLKGPAGPTYAILHYILSPITQLKIPLVRAVNVILFILSVFVMNNCFKQLKFKQIAMLGVAIPMTAVCIGMALTEMPAIFFLCLGIYFFIKKTGNDTFNKLLSGLFVSFAILGRQPLLLIIPSFIYLNGFSKKALLSTFLFLVTALVLPAYCFSVWKGLIPAAGVEAETGSLQIVHFLLALGYALICFLIIAPAFLQLPFKVKPLYLAIALLVSMAVSYYGNFQFPIMNTLAAKVLPAAVLKYYPNFCFSLLMVAALYFVVVCCYRTLEFRHDRLFLFSLSACFIILFSSLAIRHQFSSRYVFQAFPFMLILAERYFIPSTRNTLLRIGGIVMGIASLVTYLF